MINARNVVWLVALAAAVFRVGAAPAATFRVTGPGGAARQFGLVISAGSACFAACLCRGSATTEEVKGVTGDRFAGLIGASIKAVLFWLFCTRETLP